MKKSKIKPPPNWEDTPQSFERFERLAKGLMAVPKKELDKQIAKTNNEKTSPTQKKKRANGKPR